MSHLGLGEDFLFRGRICVLQEMLAAYSVKPSCFFRTSLRSLPLSKPLYSLHGKHPYPQSSQLVLHRVAIDLGQPGTANSQLIATSQLLWFLSPVCGKLFPCSRMLQDNVVPCVHSLSGIQMPVHSWAMQRNHHVEGVSPPCQEWTPSGSVAAPHDDRNQGWHALWLLLDLDYVLLQQPDSH